MRLTVLSIVLFSAATVFAGDLAVKKEFHALIADDGIQRVEIIGGNYFYDPNYIIVKKDVPVELIVMKKRGIVPHNIVIKETGADIVFKEDIGSDKKIIRFTPKKAGRFFFSCDKKLLFFKSHREKGMEGIIEVID